MDIEEQIETKKTAQAVIDIERYHYLYLVLRTILIKLVQVGWE